MPRRILVLSASVGAGHLRAAQAVELACRQAYPEFIVHNIDVLEYTNAAFRQVYGKAYLDLVNKAPHVLGLFYDLLDRPSKTGNSGDKLRLLVQKLNLTKFIKFLQAEPWDLAINTHFLPAEIIAHLRKKKDVKFPQVTVTTDFETHRLWVNQPCELYFTATAEGAEYLHSWGVPRDATRVTGIPIHPAFGEPKDRSLCQRKHGIKGDRPVVVQMAGGFGVGPIEKIYEQLLAVEPSLDIIVVCGRNEKVRKELAAVRVPPRHRAKIIGFTTEIDEILVAADLVVSKPGGLTTSETLARGVAMVIVNPIPGQESRNSDYLLENGAAIKVNNLATLAHKITNVLTTTGRLSELQAHARKIGRPRAAFDVVTESMRLLPK
jgi:processive 1,2-diacylglycerol beta-glucosyltransferase